jgi:hypothetical protein
MLNEMTPVRGSIMQRDADAVAISKRTDVRADLQIAVHFIV